MPTLRLRSNRARLSKLLDPTSLDKTQLIRNWIDAQPTHHQVDEELSPTSEIIEQPPLTPDPPPELPAAISPLKSSLEGSLTDRPNDEEPQSLASEDVLPNENQLKTSLDRFDSRSSTRSSPHLPEPEPEIDGPATPIVVAGRVSSSLLPPQARLPEPSDSDPFGFIQAERDLARAASASREDAVYAEDAASLPEDPARPDPPHPEKSPSNPPQDPRQHSDLSLGDLLNLGKNKSKRALRKNTVNIPPPASPTSSKIIDHPLPSFLPGRPTRKAKQAAAESLAQTKSRRVAAKDADSAGSSDRGVRVVRRTAREPCKVSRQKRQTTRSRRSRPDENRGATPVVVVVNTKHSQHRRVLEPKPLNQIRPARPLTSPSRKRPILHADSNPDLTLTPSPGRKARLSYFKGLDKMALEEEVIV